MCFYCLLFQSLIFTMFLTIDWRDPTSILDHQILADLKKNNIEYLQKCKKSENCQFLGVGILDQPVVELDSLHKVLNRNSLVEPMEPFCIILGDKGRSEHGDC